MMKKILLLLSMLFISACSNNDMEPIEEPTKPESEISANNNLIETFEGYLKDEQERLDKSEGIASKSTHENAVKNWKQEIRQVEQENELLEETLIYNDDFKVVQGTGIYVQKHDGMFTESTLISGFNNDMLKELERYKDEITNGAILIAAAPFESEGDKFPVISVYYSQKSLDKIDFEKALDNDEYLYKNADYVDVHNTLSNTLTSRGNFDNVPDLFAYYSGITY